MTPNKDDWEKRERDLEKIEAIKTEIQLMKSRLVSELGSENTTGNLYRNLNETVKLIKENRECLQLLKKEVIELKMWKAGIVAGLSLLVFLSGFVIHLYGVIK